MIIEQGRKKIRFSLSQFHIVLLIFFMTRPLLNVYRVGGVDVSLAMAFLLFGVVILYILKNLRAFVDLLRQDMLLVFLVLFVVVSGVWSISPTRTLSGSFNLLFGTIVGAYMAMRFSIQEQVKIVARVVLIAAVLSLIVAVFFPFLGRGVARGSVEVWSGVYQHKNGLGRYMAIGAAASWVYAYYAPRNWGYYFGFGLCVLLILLASSATALVTLTIVLVSLPLFGIMRRLRLEFRWMLFFLTVSVVGVALWVAQMLGVDLLDELLLLFGRNTERNSLLVRFRLWQYVLGFISERPLLGYGFDAFWAEGRAVEIYSGSDWNVGQSHNGFLELWLQLGLVGLVGMSLHFFLSLRSIIGHFNQWIRVEGVWIISYLLILLVFNMTYSVLLGQLTVPWTLYVAVTLSLRANNRAMAYEEELDPLPANLQYHAG